MAVVCGVIEQVASDLDALHARRRLHRDVKPANIVFDGAGVASITEPAESLGSLDYMAPEQIRSEELTPAADIYGLGCVVYECLCGAPPFADRQGMATLWAHLHDQPAKPSDRRSELPAAVDDAVLRALAKDPAKRTQSAGELARDLRAACK